MKITLTVLFCWLAGSAFAKTEFAEEGNRVTREGILTLSSSWIKDKGKKFDIGFKMKNESKDAILVHPKEIQCGRGGVSGSINQDKVVPLRAGELREVVLTCLLSEKVKGPYKLKVTKVYANPGSDGKTLGKVIGEDIAWSVDIAD